MIITDRQARVRSGAKVLCSYQNRTSTIQILRMSGPECDHFERVIFPGQIFLFEATRQSHLTIFYSISPQAIEMRQISCQTLQVNEGV